GPRGQEPAPRAGVAGRPDLLDPDQQGVVGAVDRRRADQLHVPGGVALAPVLLPGPAPEPGPPGGQGAPDRLGVHPADHQHGAVGVVLDHRADELLRVEPQAGDEVLHHGIGHGYSSNETARGPSEHPGLSWIDATRYYSRPRP